MKSVWAAPLARSKSGLKSTISAMASNLEAPKTTLAVKRKGNFHRNA